MREAVEKQAATAKAEPPQTTMDEGQTRQLRERVGQLEGRTEELSRANERLTNEKRTAENESQELKGKLGKAREDIDVLYANLQECINNNLAFKKQLEAKIEREVLLEEEIRRLKEDVEAAQSRTAAASQEARELREAQEAAERKVEELRGRIMSSEDLAYVYTVIKESFLGREKMLVG